MIEETALKYKCYNCGHTFKADDKEGKTYCPKCDKAVRLWQAKIHYLKHNDTIRKLAQGPSSDVDVTNLPLAVREGVFKLKVDPSVHGGGPKKQRVVYFLNGDLRRAVDKYIELNYKFVNEMLTKSEPYNIMRDSLSNDVYEMFREQWSWKYSEEEHE